MVMGVEGLTSEREGGMDGWMDGVVRASDGLERRGGGNVKREFDNVYEQVQRWKSFM
jgi:hypothetical protein